MEAEHDSTSMIRTAMIAQDSSMMQWPSDTISGTSGGPRGNRCLCDSSVHEHSVSGQPWIRQLWCVCRSVPFRFSESVPKCESSPGLIAMPGLRQLGQHRNGAFKRVNGLATLAARPASLNSQAGVSARQRNSSCPSARNRVDRGDIISAPTQAVETRAGPPRYICPGLRAWRTRQWLDLGTDLSPRYPESRPGLTGHSIQTPKLGRPGS